MTWLNPYSWVCLFFTGQGLRGLDVLRCRCSSQFLTPGPVSSPSQLTHSDSFEPLGGAVSGSSGFYTFTESPSSRDVSWHQCPAAVCTLSALTAYCCLVTNCFLVWKMQWFLPLLNPLHVILLNHAASPGRESFQTGSSHWLLLYSKECYYIRHFKSVTAQNLHFICWLETVYPEQELVDVPGWYCRLQGHVLLSWESFGGIFLCIMLVPYLRYVLFAQLLKNWSFF